ncbi:MAG TPA: N-methyl-L-tryptophan oxidase [Rhizomicrobium sp.]|jgi:sarcosine oxidase
MTRFDTIVLGLGALGSATLQELSRRGQRVLGIDRFDPPHRMGSSHGGTRITRVAIGEGEHLAPLAARSHILWREIEAATGTELMTLNGLLVISSPAKTSFTHVEDFFANTLAAAERFGVPHELLDTGALRARFPQFRVSDAEVGYFEPAAGFLRPEACVAAQLSLARKQGAILRTGETATHFASSPHEVEVTTDKGTYVADRLILTAGPWLPELLGPPFAKLFRIIRQVQFWFAPAADAAAFGPADFPTFIWELSGRSQAIYGFPALDSDGVKVASEQYHTTTSPAAVSRDVEAQEAVSMHRDYVEAFLPDVSAACRRAEACLYTVTPDFGFVVDRHPDSERVMVASCCSGHGFKHSAALGEALAELATQGRSDLDLAPFALARFHRS